MSSISRPLIKTQLSYKTIKSEFDSSIFNQVSKDSISDILSQKLSVTDGFRNANVKYEIIDFNQYQQENGIEQEDNTMHMDSVLRKRRLKMKKHKLRKRRREQRSLKRRLGKI
ncbi:uncharacterized protein RJT21DRAFT_1266 [Scheffersomyces amazonensis]|uniref:uncharacterized protein n=1 Tax=Scheffersomyces amazonensis TaxID=1078765 RepID=UPI00315C78BC